MKLIIFILLAFLAFTALSTAAADANREYYVFRPGGTYVYDAAIRRWKLLVPLKN